MDIQLDEDFRFEVVRLKNLIERPDLDGNFRGSSSRRKQARMQILHFEKGRGWCKSVAVEDATALRRTQSQLSRMESTITTKPSDQYLVAVFERLVAVDLALGEEATCHGRKLADVGTNIDDGPNL